MWPAHAAGLISISSGSDSEQLATGITRGFAEYEALLIIRQVTGNWPIETDRIVNPVYSCRQGSVLWTCLARAQVCKR